VKKVSNKSHQVEDNTILPVMLDDPFPNIRKLVVSFKEFLRENNLHNSLDSEEKNHKKDIKKLSKGDNNYKNILSRELE
jgi:hypothetical protein